MNADHYLNRYAEVNGLTAQDLAELRGIMDLARHEATVEAQRTIMSMAERIDAQKDILQRAAEKSTKTVAEKGNENAGQT